VDRNEREEHNLRVTTRHPHDYTATSKNDPTLVLKLCVSLINSAVVNYL